MKPKRKTGVELIAEERQRQMDGEGWTRTHDRRHPSGALAMAAVCYAADEPIYTRQTATIGGNSEMPIEQFRFPWPFDAFYFKPKDRLRNLVRAGALIAAEIDKMRRT